MWSQSGYCNHLAHPVHPFYHAPCSHNQRTTTFRHPVTGQVSSENVDFFLQQQPGVIHMSKPQGDLRPSSTVSEASTAVTTTSTVDVPSGPKVSRSSSRVHSFGKRDQAIKRNPNVAVVVRGWLYKQDSSGMRLWKRKWFVLADYCLFYYKDSREELVLGSIPLPSYVVSAVQPEDHISRKYAFKASHTGMRSYIYKQSSMVGSQAEHVGMRTYYFSADTQEDMNGWLKAMNQAALMQSQGGTLDRPSGSQSEVLESAEQQAVPQTNNVHHHHPAQPEPEEILLQPTPFLRDADECCSFHRDAPLAPASDPPGGLAAEETASLLSDAAPLLDPESAPGSRVPSRAPSRAASTLPPGAGTRNGSMRTPPTPIQEPNGIGAGTYVRASTLPSMDAHRHGQRRSALEQVEHWVKVQRAEHKGPPSREGTLPRRTPPTQPKFASMEAYQSLPKNPSPPTVARQGEYKYAQDRLSHFHLLPEGPHQAGPVWQLYEWQQRHQYRHGSPTAPLYTPAPDYPYGPRPASTVPPASAAPRSGSLGGPRCVSVPPSPSDIPPPGPPPGFSRTMSPNKRPHTPAGRLTVQPQGDRSLVDGPFSGSPRRAKSQLLKAATIERRSMPPSGYITHTVSAPSLHGKTPEELTLLLIQLRRHQAKMASARHHTLVQLRQLNCPKVPLHHHLLSTTYTGDTASPFLSGPSNLPLPGPSKTQVDDTYLQLKKDLEYLDLKVVGSQTLKEAGKPLKVAESDVDVKLSRLCEQDKILRELEVRLCSLKEDKDKLEVVLDMTHQQMEQYQDQPAHAHKIAYQQKLLQEDLVNIRAQVSRASTEMERAWEEYSCLESSVEQLRTLLQAHMNHSATPQQEKSEIKRELWRIEDVMGGLSSTKSNYQVTIDSVQNPERKLVPSVSDAATPSQSAEVPPPPRSSNASPAPPTQLLNTVPKWAEDEAPPRPPLPHVYDYEDVPPVVPPLPRDASVIRHTSVRGLKRQSDERKRDREGGHYVNGDSKVELRSYLSEPELQGMSGGAGGREADYQMLPDKGLPGSSFRLNQSNNISSYVTLRRGAGSLATKERPKSALERLYSSSDDPSAIGAAGSSSQQRGRMSAEEQLERMKRHQRALVRERKRNLSQGERCSTASTGSTQRSSSSGARLAAASSEPPPAAQQGEDSKATQVEEERLGAEGQSDEGQSLVKEDQRNQSEEWLTVIAKPMREVDLEPVDYDLDLSRELSMPQKVPIPERYVESDPDDPISPEEEEERSRRADRIKTILAKSNVQKMQQSSGVCGPVDCTDLESVLQQQERIMSVSHALASEASRKSKLVAESEGKMVYRYREAKASSEQ